VSQRRACKTLGQPRSTQRYQASEKEDEQRLVGRILELVGEFPRYGYRMITRLLRQEGWQVNFKRIYRIWKREGLKVPVKKTKKRRWAIVTAALGVVALSVSTMFGQSTSFSIEPRTAVR
jgi:putative transposase